ncbi:MAG: phosphoglycerate kinase [bacterium]
MKKLQSLLQADLQGKRVLVRFDLNVPIGDDGVVHDEDADRIRKSLPTLEYLKNAGAKVIIIAHIGRDPKETLKPVANYMNIPLFPLKDFSVAELDNNQVVILENLRSTPEEESNDPAFSALLAAYAELYVNDAFSVSHRAHASVVGVAQLLPAYAGLQLEQEIENLDRALHPEHPALLIMGGAKFETKLPVIQKLLPLVDVVFIGGALVNNFYKEKGYEVGKSLLDPEAHLGDLVNNSKIIISDQVVVQNDGENDIGGPAKFAQQISPADRIVDVVIPELLIQKINESKTIIWNGPMGNYENGFSTGTESLTRIIAASGTYSIIGGGDSVALIEKLGLEKSFGFLSTGGGAMLEYLVQGTLPGIEALK